MGLLASHTELRVEFDRRRRTVAAGRAYLIRSLHLRLQWAGCVILCAICLLVLSAAQGCKKPNQAAPEVVLTIIDQSWLDKPSQALLGEELKQFTKETGIRVQVLPAPEVAVDQLETWRNLLESGSKVPDVYGIDVIWPGILGDNLVDLKAYVPEQEIARVLSGTHQEQYRQRQACGFALQPRRRTAFLSGRSVAQVRLRCAAEDMGRA